MREQHPIQPGDGEGSPKDNGLTDVEFIDRVILNHKPVELDQREEEVAATRHAEFEGGDEGAIEYEIGDLIFSCQYSKFRYAYHEGQDPKELTARERLASIELSGCNLSEDEYDNLYSVTGATLTSKETGKEQNLLESGRYLAIIFIGSEHPSSSSFSALSKVLLLRKNPTTLAGVVVMLHEIGHSAMIKGAQKTLEAVKASDAVHGDVKEADLYRNMRIYAQNEAQASNHAYGQIKAVSHDHELLALSKKLLERSLASHLAGLKRLYDKINRGQNQK